MLIVSLLSLLGTALALPQALQEKSLFPPSVWIQNGTVIGCTDGVVDSFKGIPYAQPPVGPLRLKPPQSITEPFGTIQAVGIPTACPQFFIQIDKSNIPQSVLGELADDPLSQKATVAGEDCLTINVQRPAGTTSWSKLPVMFWIFGGGFEFGSTQSYDGEKIVHQSILLGKPIIFVAVNYRVGGFGFLAGKELTAEWSTNLGLRDQRLALQWVQENIAAFGGDPSRVTLFGESAGSISVFDQTIINGGDNTYNGKPLFQGAIMNSGSIIPALPSDSSPAQSIYDHVVAAAGCSNALNTLECLRCADYTTFLNAVNSVPSLLSYRALDLSYLPRPDPSSSFYSVSPELAIEGGWFAKVPIIIGDQEDEGSLFAFLEGNITTTDELVTYLATYFPWTPRDVVAGLVATYPDDPTAGSPFNTGYFNEVYPQFKRLAAILGDITFTLSRRGYLSFVSEHVSAWSYISTYFYGTPLVGTFHGSDLVEIFHPAPPLPIPSLSILTYYISFVNCLDPNAISTSYPLIPWPKYDCSSRQLLDFQEKCNKLACDDFRAESYQYLLDHVTEFRV